MSMVGLIALLLAFAGCVVSVVCVAVGHKLYATKPELSETLSWGGRIAVLLTFAGLTVACGVLIVCFMTGNLSIQYVLDNYSYNSTSLGWLYRLSGLWAGRQGSLLFWAWIISIFGAVVALRRLNANDKLDNIALLVIQVVLAAFVGVLMLSEDNMPFAVIGEEYLNPDGTINAMASISGMNTLLEHWAMAIHPPTLFVGYAGLTVPFAYAVAAVVVNDPSRRWVDYCTRYTLVSWVFLSAGIGLGAVWAYVVLGWGGYWGWDPVENASLLSWIMCVALVHCFTAYRQRGSFKCWTVLFACFTFAFVIVGTFISRSGLVQSVHAFEGDTVSLVLFGALIAVSMIVGIVGALLRRKSFAPEHGEFESMVSRDGMYFINCVFLLLMTFLLAYMTLSSALPGWLPFGGESLSVGSYNALARPLGIVYLLMVAVGPIMGWNKTDGPAFRKKMKVPALAALVLFVLLMVFFFVKLLPAYNATMAAGGSEAEALMEQGPSFYYNGLAVVGFAVASLLLFNSLAMARRALGARKARRFSALGGSIAHAGLAVVLVGLIGSSMYVTTVTGYIAYDGSTDTASETFVADDYEMSFVNSDVEVLLNGDAVFTVNFDVTKNGRDMGSVAPSIQMTQLQQQKLNAAVIGLPYEDFFVVFKGVGAEGASISMEARINPLISLVWIGFVILVIGTAIGLVGRKRA